MAWNFWLEARTGKGAVGRLSGMVMILPSKNHEKTGKLNIGQSSIFLPDPPKENRLRHSGM